MPTLLCTAKYRKTFGLPERLEIGDTREGALGPWYANTLNVGSRRMLHYMSGPSLLSVFIPLRERRTAEQRFISTLGDLLVELRVDERYIASEVELLTDTRYGRASDRSKLGSLLDQANLASFRIADDDVSIAELNFEIAHTPCEPIRNFPDRLAPELLERTWRWTAR